MVDILLGKIHLGELLERVEEESGARRRRLGLSVELLSNEFEENGKKLYGRLSLIVELGGSVYNILVLAFCGKLVTENLRDNPFVAINGCRYRNLDEKAYG